MNLFARISNSFHTKAQSKLDKCCYRSYKINLEQTKPLQKQEFKDYLKIERYIYQNILI